MSSIQLNDHHFILQSANSVQRLCEPLTRHFDITYFDYCKIYRDGRMSILANDPYWVKHFFSVNYPAGGQIKKSGVYLWPTHLPEQAIIDARLHFNHDNGMTVIFEHQDHIEFFDCASSKSNHKILYYYMNHFDVFKNFFTYFKERANDLIALADENSISLNEKIKQQPFDLTCLSEINKLKKGMNALNVHLSQRQIECLIYLSKGMTARQMSEIMELSPRTVEHYLNTTKIKLGCSQRSSLLKRAKDLGFLGVG